MDSSHRVLNRSAATALHRHFLALCLLGTAAAAGAKVALLCIAFWLPAASRGVVVVAQAAGPAQENAITIPRPNLSKL